MKRNGYNKIVNLDTAGSRLEQFFDQTFRQFFPPLCLFANRFVKNEEDAADLVQEVFVELWEDESITEKQAHIQPWLYSVVRNRCIDWLRRKQVKEKRIVEYINREVLAGEEIEEVVKTETTRQLMGALDSLPPGTRRLIIDHYIHGRKYTEIADEQNRNYDSIQKQAARAIMALRKKIRSLVLSII